MCQMILKLSLVRVTYNGKRLGDVAVFENRQTEPKPNRITNDDDKYKSSIVKV